MCIPYNRFKMDFDRIGVTRSSLLNDGMTHSYGAEIIIDSELTFPPLKVRKENRSVSLYKKQIKHSTYHKELADKFEKEHDLRSLLRRIVSEFYIPGDDKLEISRFALRLLLFLDNFSNNEEDVKGYLIYSLRYGPQYAEHLKKIRALAFIQSVQLRASQDFTEKAEFYSTWDLRPRLDLDKKYSYDDFLHEQYLLPFEEGTADYLWAFKPVEDTNEALDLFRTYCRRLLSDFKIDSLAFPEPFEEQLWISESSTFDDERQRSRNNKQIIRDKRRIGVKHIPSTEDLTFKRTVINVGPANCRDAWMPNIESLFTIKRNSYILRQILERIPYSAMCSPDKAYMRKRKFLKKDSFYGMIDFKKCGLTINRELLKILRETIYEIYEVDLIGLDFRNVKVWDVDSYQCPLRGTGLGNANESVTLIQCVVGHMMKLMYDADSIFFNDDGIYKFKSLPKEEFLRLITLWRNLGMVINLSKSFLSASNVFCEEYFITDSLEINYQKLQLRVIPYAECFYQNTPYRSKKLFYGLNRLNIGSRIDDSSILKLLIARTEPEFFFAEYILPFQFGGWRERSETNYSDLLNFLGNMREYIPRIPRVEAQTALIRKWVGYLLENAIDLDFPERQIPFKERLDNSVDEFGLSDMSEGFLYSFTNIRNPSEINKSLDELINGRGNKNAKPTIKLGLEMVNHYRRKKVYRSLPKGNDPMMFSLDAGSIGAYIRLYRKNPLYPREFSLPRFLVREEAPVPKNTMRGNVIFSIPKVTLPRVSLREVESLNIALENRLFSSSVIWTYPLDRIRNSRQGYLVANLNLNRQFLHCSVNLPDICYYLSNDLALLICEYVSRYSQLPIAFRALYPMRKPKQIYLDRLTEIGGKAFSDLILHLSRTSYEHNVLEDSYQLQRTINWKKLDRPHFRAIWDREIQVKQDPQKIMSSLPEYDEDILDAIRVLELFDDDLLYESYFGEKDLDQLLEDEDLESFDDEDLSFGCEESDEEMTFDEGDLDDRELAHLMRGDNLDFLD